MKFNIKNWQDKHLIKESKGLKREIDFKSDDAFKKYNSKHKMRATTKVNIAGKDTTAGEVEGGEKKAPSKSITAPVNVKSLSDKISKARANSDWSNEDAIDNLDQLLQDTGAYDKEELTFEDGMKAIQDLDNYQDGDGRYNDEDEAYDAKTEMQDELIDLFDEPEGGWTNDNRGNVKADGSSHDYSELNPIGNSKAPQLQYSDDDDDGSDEGGDREKSAKAIKTFVKDNEDAVRSYTHSVLSDNMGTSEAAVEYLGWSEEEAEDADFNVYDDVVDKFMDDPETMEEYISGKDEDGDLQAGMDQIKKEYEDDPNVYESVTPNSTRIQEARIYKTIQELRALEKNI